MDLGLGGKVGIVTGASGGIGTAIVRELGREGCRLLLTARDEARLAERRKEVESAGGQALVHKVDLRAPDAPGDIVAAALAEYGRIDFVVTNAGTAKMGDIFSIGDADWRDGFDLKFFAHVRLITAAWANLRASGGAVVIIAGAAGRTPNATGVITGCVNGALLTLAKALAAQGVADGVRVNAVNPGMTRTERFAGRLQKTMKEHGIDAAEAEQRMVKESGIMRVGDPEEIAAVVAFLLGSRAGFVHGAVIDVDGGKTKTL